MMPWQKDLFVKMSGMKKGEMTIMMAGRQTGKSTWANAAHILQTMLAKNKQPARIVWINKDPLQLVATTANEAKNFYINFLTEEDMVAIQEWCVEHNCGKRTSFDTFKFKNKKQITMFLLRWS